MKKLPIFIGVFAFVASIYAQEVSLFNGKDLSGWEGNSELWSVKDGVIHGETKVSQDNPQKSTLRHNTFLVLKDRKPANFELRLKYRFVSEAGNSGIQAPQVSVPGAPSQLDGRDKRSVAVVGIGRLPHQLSVPASSQFGSPGEREGENRCGLPLTRRLSLRF